MSTSSRTLATLSPGPLSWQEGSSNGDLHNQALAFSRRPTTFHPFQTPKTTVPSVIDQTSTVGVHPRDQAPPRIPLSEVPQLTSGSMFTKTQVQNFSTNTDKLSTISRKPVNQFDPSGLVQRNQISATGLDSGNQTTNSGSGLSIFSGTENNVAPGAKGLSETRDTGEMGVDDPIDPIQHQPSHSLFLTLKTHNGQNSDKSAPHHTITLRDVSSTENPTLPLDTEGEALAQTGIQSPSPALVPLSNYITTSNPTSLMENGSSVEGGRDGTTKMTTDSLVSLTNVTEVINSTGASWPAANDSDTSKAPSTASGSFMNRQVPATTQGPWGSGNQSGPAQMPPQKHTICLDKMDIVWLVLVISVPVSSCCE